MLGSSKFGSFLGTGLAGAIAVTVAHQVTRELIPEVAPRADVLGRRAIAVAMSALGFEVPRGQALQGFAFAGDVLTNTALYGMIHSSNPGHRPWMRGVILGALAGMTVVAAPPRLGLGSAPTGRTPMTKALTVGLYVLGGLAAAGISSLISGRRRKSVLADARARADEVRRKPIEAVSMTMS